MQNLIKTDLFDLAPINPNVNNIYYDYESYKNAIINYISSEFNVVYSNYDNDTYYNDTYYKDKFNLDESFTHVKIGNLIDINFSNNTAKVDINNLFYFYIFLTNFL